ncbi:serine/threonine protein kinase, variant [Aphanomyces astaci]|nr:serine/threonine protein kinase, variant [Aphanomyces astaci]ETV85206.1 serine/threonine protein kinase, variant [Aphanomyces astaci]|eukprot:XP_009825224.1 serine/threonine protein kinase, variant [Aphanomyces astaci]
MGRLDVVRVLLPVAQVDQIDHTGRSALHSAAELDYPHVVAELVAANANVQLRDMAGRTPLDLAMRCNNTTVVEVMRECLAADEALATILREGLSWNHRFQNGKSVLILAARRGRVDIAQAAIAHGCDVNLHDFAHNTALLWAARNGHLNMVDLLTTCRPDCDLNSRGYMNWTPLQWALHNKHFHVAHILVGRGCSWLLPWQGKLLLEVLAPVLSEHVALRMVLRDLPICVVDGHVVERPGHSYSWATFLDPNLPVRSTVRANVVQAVLQHPSWTTGATHVADVYKALQNAKDRHGRRALQLSDGSTRSLFKHLLYFCARYEIFDGPPVYVGPKVVVVHAFDHGICHQVFDMNTTDLGVLDLSGFIAANQMLGQWSAERHSAHRKTENDLAKWNHAFGHWDKDKNGQLNLNEFLGYCDHICGGQLKVAMKFMASHADYMREVRCRRLVHKPVVLELLPALDPSVFRDGVANLHLTCQGHTTIAMAPYENVLVLPAADRSLDDIWTKEHPSDHQMRSYLLDVATGLQHLHECNVVHGDLKASNVLRVHNQLKLIGLDAARSVGQMMGSKFTSGILPPELFYKLNTPEEEAMHDAYWRGGGAAMTCRSWAKIKPRGGVVVRVGHSHEKSPNAGLPYEVATAATAIDAWALGCLVYQMYSGMELVATDNYQDVVVDRMLSAASWTDDALRQRVHSHVHDDLAQDMVLKLLVVTPSARATMEAVVSHPYFAGRSSSAISCVTAVVQSQVNLMARLDKLSVALEDQATTIDRRSRHVLSKVESTTMNLVTAMFAAADDTKDMPSAFVLLPCKLETLATPASEEIHSFVRNLCGILDQIVDALAAEAPVAPLVAALTHGEPRYLYLVDERSGQLVLPPEEDDHKHVYPILLSTESTENYMDFVAVTLPCIQRGLGLLQKGNWLAHGFDKSESVDKASLDVGKAHARTAAVRALHEVLRKFDPERTFAGLERVVLEDGAIIWTKQPKQQNAVSMA